MQKKGEKRTISLHGLPCSFYSTHTVQPSATFTHFPTWADEVGGSGVSGQSQMQLLVPAPGKPPPGTAEELLLDKFSMQYCLQAACALCARHLEQVISSKAPQAKGLSTNAIFASCLPNRRQWAFASFTNNGKRKH